MLLLPVGTDQARRRAPVATAALVGLNLAGFLASAGNGVYETVLEMGFLPASPDPLRFALSHFLHIGVLHLASNLLVLSVFGPPIEDRIGGARFAACYAAGGAGALLCDWGLGALFRPEALDLPHVGASGAVSALLGIFLLRLPFARVGILWWVPLLGRGRFDVAAAALLPFWMAVELWYGFLSAASGQIGGTAHFAHIGGFVVGALAAVPLRLHGEGRVEGRLSAIERLIEAGDAEQAEHKLAALMPGAARVAEVHYLLCRARARLGRAREAAGSLSRAIELWDEAGRKGNADDGAVEMAALHPGFPFSPSQLARLSAAAESRGRPAAAAAFLSRLLAEFPRHALAAAAKPRLAKLALLVPEAPAPAGPPAGEDLSDLRSAGRSLLDEPSAEEDERGSRRRLRTAAAAIAGAAAGTAVLVPLLASGRWQVFPIAGPPAKPLHGVAWSSAAAWAAGDAGELLRLVGRRWRREVMPTSAALRCLEIAPDGAVWCGGSHGAIFRRVLGGSAQWESVVSPSDRALRRFSFAAGDDGFACGDDGLLLRWNGVRWTQEVSPAVGRDEAAPRVPAGHAYWLPLVDPRLREQRFATRYAPGPSLVSLSRNAGGAWYAAGERGTLLARTDAGWGAVAPPVQGDLSAVCTTAAGGLLIAGSDGKGAHGLWSGAPGAWTRLWSSPRGWRIVSAQVALAGAGWMLVTDGRTSAILRVRDGRVIPFAPRIPIVARDFRLDAAGHGWVVGDGLAGWP